ncbi:unnamed protein product [Coffea canephora]|uniref:Fe2OG dioxygenase domain-containing protein n=1 Tax=Coffea canephora TaxID=49390 RepID=A0A068UN76_COFCA|nr:unnamed protein product [Coffea canephora]
MANSALQLPIIDLSCSDRISTAQSIRQACMEYGFFYLINHGVEEELLKRVFEESRKFFVLPSEEKMKVVLKDHRGYTPHYAEKLDPSSISKGDSKESFYVGPLEDVKNQWPPAELLPLWRSTMEEYHKSVLNAGKRLISLVALALNLDEDFFTKVGALDPPNGYLRLLHYPAELGVADQQMYGASAHSDYGMITLLAAEDVGGLQACFHRICREKFEQNQVWEDVHHVNGAFIVNIADMMERWTNCLFRSTFHRVLHTGRERYSAAFFLDGNPDCMVECLKSCCSESRPPRYPPIRIGDHLQQRFRITYG